jgi:hypothetical protein
MRLIMVSALALAFAACGSADGSGDGRSDGEIQMKAGKWSNTMVVEKFELPGAPPEVAGMLQGMIGQEQTTETCMTQDQVDKGWEEQAKNSMQGQACETDSFDADGGSLNGKVTCKAENGGGATMTIEGDYAAEQMNMTMTAEISDPSMPGGSGTMVMKMSGKRIGDCDE